MPRQGDSYTIPLGPAHLGWGEHRYTDTRERVAGEGYIPIPKEHAQAYGIYNSNQCGGQDVLGVNIYNCRSEDGFFNGQLKAQGVARAGDVYAKQFSGNDDLRAIGSWFAHCNAQVGDHVEVRWTSPNDIVIRHF